MTVEQWIAITGIILGSGAFCKIIDSICHSIENKRKKKLNKKDKIDVLDEKVDKLIDTELKHEVTRIRIELMMLIHDYPNNWEDISKLAEKYFVEYHGNSYMSSLYDEWLKSKDLQRPAWLNTVLEKEKENLTNKG